MAVVRAVGIRVGDIDCFHPGQERGRGDVAQGRVAQELEQRQPRHQQDEEEPLVGQAMPAFQELDAEVFENAVAGVFFHARMVWLIESS